MTDTPENFPEDDGMDEFLPEDDYIDDEILDEDSSDDESAEEDRGERIAKVLARAGVCSRRDAEKMIAARRVAVNGTVLDTPAFLVGAGDRVTVDGAALKAVEEARVWRYHKPPGRVTTHKDPQGRPTVFDAMPREMPRVVSIGRLDLNSEGLLLLTNDGTLAGILENPKTGWVRRYRVRVYGVVTAARLESLRDGVTVEGVRYGPIVAELERQQGGNAWINVALTEGKNREIRKVMDHIGYRVNRLIRMSYGPFSLGRLDRGEVEEIPFKVLRDQLSSLGDTVPTALRSKTRSAGWAKAKPRPVKPGDKARAKARAQGKSFERERPAVTDDQRRSRSARPAAETNRPDSSRPDSSRPEGERSAGGRPGSARPGTNRSGTARPDAGRPARSGNGGPGGGKPRTGRPTTPGRKPAGPGKPGGGR